MQRERFLFGPQAIGHGQERRHADARAKEQVFRCAGIEGEEIAGRAHFQFRAGPYGIVQGR
jgi:hypothetical protein